MHVIFIKEAEEFTNVDILWEEVEYWAERPAGYDRDGHHSVPHGAAPWRRGPARDANDAGGTAACPSSWPSRRTAQRSARRDAQRPARWVRRCYICEDPGHLAKNCPEKRSGGPDKQDTHKDDDKPSAGKKRP